MIVYGHSKGFAVGKRDIDTDVVTTTHEMSHDVLDDVVVRLGFIIVITNANVDVWRIRVE